MSNWYILIVLFLLGELLILARLILDDISVRFMRL